MILRDIFSLVKTYSICDCTGVLISP